MRNLKLALEVDNRASAIVTGTGNAVKLEVDPELMWDREGLLNSQRRSQVSRGCCQSSEKEKRRGRLYPVRVRYKKV